MKTIWGENIDVNNVLPEYPRPQMARESYINLNGIWEYAITDTEDLPESFDGEIVVPFSPESELSGVKRFLEPAQTLWYRRSLTLPRDFNVGRILLHFGAVDQIATVYVNGREVCSHVGGYTPFSADITECSTDGEIEIVVKVRDHSDTSYHSRGKQKIRRGGIWYTPQSGIWQTVWLESVPEQYIKGLRITPLYDESEVELLVMSDSDLQCKAICCESEILFKANEPARLHIDPFVPWTPENPHLYDLAVEMGKDRVKSYFGMRKFSVELDEHGVKRLFLNNRPYFHNGLLDQGYYCDGLYTPPSDEAMIFDIRTAKDLGFNMLRKHIKIEPLRWYYHCDRLGMLVWQDMVNGGGNYGFLTATTPLVTGIHFKDSRYKLFGREDPEGREQYFRELDEMINHLYNAVSIAMWVPFNEGWGQFDAEEAADRIRRLDTTRTIDHASGWHDQYIGDIKSLHVYFRKYRFRKDRLGRAVVLSEFGGYNHRVEGHCFNDKDYGYRRFASREELLAALRDLYLGEIIPAKGKGLSAAVYTQLTDVEDELNGFITYDRKVVKIHPDEIKDLMEMLLD